MMSKKFFKMKLNWDGFQNAVTQEMKKLFNSLSIKNYHRVSIFGNF